MDRRPARLAGIAVLALSLAFTACEAQTTPSPSVASSSPPAASPASAQIGWVRAGIDAGPGPVVVDYYRVVDDRTLLVGTISRPGAWVRVTSVTETPSTVTITVTTLFVQIGPGTAAGVPYESLAKLRDPLGNRMVIDGSGGSPVQQAKCRPPAVFASVCT